MFLTYDILDILQLKVFEDADLESELNCKKSSGFNMANQN